MMEEKIKKIREMAENLQFFFKITEGLLEDDFLEYFPFSLHTECHCDSCENRQYSRSKNMNGDTVIYSFDPFILGMSNEYLPNRWLRAFVDPCRFILVKEELIIFFISVSCDREHLRHKFLYVPEFFKKYVDKFGYDGMDEFNRLLCIFGKSAKVFEIKHYVGNRTDAFNAKSVFSKAVRDILKIINFSKIKEDQLLSFSSRVEIKLAQRNEEEEIRDCLINDLYELLERSINYFALHLKDKGFKKQLLDKAEKIINMSNALLEEGIRKKIELEKFFKSFS